MIQIKHITFYRHCKAFIEYIKINKLFFYKNDHCAVLFFKIYLQYQFL